MLRPPPFQDGRICTQMRHSSIRQSIIRQSLQHSQWRSYVRSHQHPSFGEAAILQLGWPHHILFERTTNRKFKISFGTTPVLQHLLTTESRSLNLNDSTWKVHKAKRRKHLGYWIHFAVHENVHGRSGKASWDPKHRGISVGFRGVRSRACTVN